MTRRVAKKIWLAGLLLAFSALAGAHPGHEFHVEGTVTKVRAQQFEVDEGRLGTTVFVLVPGTEIFMGDARASVSDIVVGRQAEVDGVENERGQVEAKKVKLTR